MRKLVLSLTLLSSMTLSAQALDQSNEPAIGEEATMFLCDSFVTNLSGVTGTGVTWDYSTLTVYSGETRLIKVDDPSVSANSSYFSGSQKMFSMGSLMDNFWSSDASGRSSQGFVYHEESLGDVIVAWETDEQVLANYAFSYPMYVDDAFSGMIYSDMGDAVAIGNGRASIDGEGTLLFPGSVSVSNVIRYHVTDTATADFGGFIGEVEVIRSQYDYYDIANESLPIFIHSTITINSAITGELTQSIVLSQYGGSGVGIEELNAQDFVVYPNPADEMLNIQLHGNESGLVKVVDVNGAVVISKEIDGSHSSIDVSGLNKGMYFVEFIQQNNKTTRKFIKE